MLNAANLFSLSKLSSAAALLLAPALLTSCSAPEDNLSKDIPASPYLFVFAGDQDQQDEDFLVVIDVDPESENLGKPIYSKPIGHKMSMPHHMEYVRPPVGEPIFMNAHHHELTMVVDVNNVDDIQIKKSFKPPAPLRFPHDYTRTPSGTRLAGFLRSNGPSPNPEEKTDPGNHGGIAEYSADGKLLRTVSAAVAGYEKPIRPYAFAVLPLQDRFVVTSAPMMEQSWADVIQIYRYSDFKLLHTMELPVGRVNGQVIEGSQAAGFGPRVLDDGSVFLNSYGCAFYHLTDIGTDQPKLDMVHALETKPTDNPDIIRGACGIPYRVGNYWLQPAGLEAMVVVLDISDPKNPKEVQRIETPEDFKPHWLAKDPKGSRLVLGAEMGFEEGFYVFRFDEKNGTLQFDTNFQGKRGSGWRSWFNPTSPGYISFDLDDWPHGKTGQAWGHAALFLGADAAPKAAAAK